MDNDNKAPGEEITVLRTFPTGSRHPSGIVLVCPVCGSHHWLSFAADGVYACPLDGNTFVAKGVRHE